MQMLVPALFLALILSLFSVRLQDRLRKATRGTRLFAVPLLLSAVFWLLLWFHGTFRWQLIVLIVVYTLPPTAMVFLRLPDILAILWLWLPLELGAGARWIPRAAQAPLHTAAYGVAITLALFLFLIYRNWTTMKYRLPRKLRDFAYPVIGFLIAAPVLIALGLVIGFIHPFHVPPRLPLLKTYALILAATALPEEILFRGLIQNWLTRKLGSSNRTIFLAALIFGLAHLNNGPQALPNWRYAMEATIAGFAFGKVFQKSSSILSSAMLHAAINTVKHIFF